MLELKNEISKYSKKNRFIVQNSEKKDEVSNYLFSNLAVLLREG